MARGRPTLSDAEKAEAKAAREEARRIKLAAIKLDMAEFGLTSAEDVQKILKAKIAALKKIIAELEKLV